MLNLYVFTVCLFLWKSYQILFLVALSNVNHAVNWEFIYNGTSFPPDVLKPTGPLVFLTMYYRR